MRINDVVINVASVNGSGSQSANNILVKSFFRLGLPVSGKNLFPSNIAGLPTWFSIRVNAKAHLSYQKKSDVVVAMNPDTFKADLASLNEGGVFIYNSDLKLPGVDWRVDSRIDTLNVPLPCRELIAGVTDSVKLKKLLSNMLYVGVLAELLDIDLSVIEKVIKDQFKEKANVVESNMKAVLAGVTYAKEKADKAKCGFRVAEIKKGNAEKILIDGNTSGALGLLYGGCSFVSWYPITPSSSLAENFIDLAGTHRKDASGKNKFAVVQAEDELSAISMVLGASWTGARAMTATSGPGLSLMAEAAGLSYFAEVPAVIWDVQRAGPSTGLPTRTMQGDLSAAYRLSHGDTHHVVLLPGSPQECFEFGQTCFDLSERLQTLVIVLSDLDLGMNFWISEKFKYNAKAYDRGKVLNATELSKLAAPFQRYQDRDDDGICWRTLPGTEHEQGAFFTRGTGHTDSAKYSEDSDTYQRLLDRIKKKYKTAEKYVPAPVIEKTSAEIGLIGYGSSDLAIREARELLQAAGIATSYLRLRALPLTNEVKDFVRTHQHIFVIEQNRDGQLCEILKSELNEGWQKLHSIRQYDGLPLAAATIVKPIQDFGRSH